MTNFEFSRLVLQTSSNRGYTDFISAFILSYNFYFLTSFTFCVVIRSTYRYGIFFTDMAFTSILSLIFSTILNEIRSTDIF